MNLKFATAFNLNKCFEQIKISMLLYAWLTILYKYHAAPALTIKATDDPENLDDNSLYTYVYSNIYVYDIDI